jgi:hypothetical protein
LSLSKTLLITATEHAFLADVNVSIVYQEWPVWGVHRGVKCAPMAKFDADKWIAISAMVVSVGTLVALSYQALLMRDAERASKLPYLYFSLLSNDQQGVEILLANSGIGPAIVDGVHIRYEGRDIAADPYDFYIGLSEENRKGGAGVDRALRRRAVPASQYWGN